MVVGPDGQFLSQRTHPQLACWNASWIGNHLYLEHELYGHHMVNAFTPTGNLYTIWDNQVLGADGGDECASFLAQDLGEGTRLVTFAPGASRPVDQRYGQPNDIVSFADGYPALLTTEESLASLNNQMVESLPMDRFRPNIVVSGANPWDEDGWKYLSIGEVEFENAKPCDRCSVTTVNQVTGEKTGDEPLRTLAKTRRLGNKVTFGINLIPRTLGTIKLGDLVHITQAG
jgi:hypothetical protein